MPKHKTQLRISGMHCAVCAKTIEKALLRAKGVRKARVNFATETAYVEYNDEQIDKEKLVQIIRKTGYNVSEELEKITLRIGGMTCASCAQIIAKTLEKIDGIKGSTVNLATEKATISFYTAKINSKKITKAIEDIGYKFLE